MRLVIDAVAAAPGGGGLTRVRELARSLPKVRPHDDRLFVVRPELVEVVREHDPGARMVVRPPLGAPLPARICWEHAVLPLKLADFAPEVVFSPFNVLPVWWRAPRPALVVMISNLAPFARECLDVCTPAERRRNVVLRTLTIRSVRRADRVIILSSQALDLIDAAGAWQDRAELVPQAPPPVPPAGGPAAAWPRPYALVAADWYKFKGLDTVVEALGRLPPDGRPDVLFCGRPMESEYVAAVMRRVKELEVEDSVHVLGQRPHAEILELMRGAVACVAPSRFENLSRVTAEAMAAGAPIVARDVPSYREACGGAALYFTGADDLADALARIPADDALQDSLRRRGSTRISSMSSDTGAARIADVLAAVAP
ncbi:MAG TPA: glycosyltransferase [Solirubrobacteraceae bacterium]|nr:glycosyltransferase [Solirubrobacteraceae bacterium]